MRVVLHAGAVADLTAAGDWYESQRPGLAAELSAEVDRALQVIAENPLAWPRWPESPTQWNVRRFLLLRFPFALAYRVQTDRLVVLAVAHGKRRPDYWQSRIADPSELDD